MSAHPLQSIGFRCETWSQKLAVVLLHLGGTWNQHNISLSRLGIKKGSEIKWKWDCCSIDQSQIFCCCCSTMLFISGWLITGDVKYNFSIFCGKILFQEIFSPPPPLRQECLPCQCTECWNFNVLFQNFNWTQPANLANARISMYYLRIFSKLELSPTWGGWGSRQRRVGSDFCSAGKAQTCEI